MTSMASQPVYQFYAKLKDFEPKIWRRFQVPGNITMAQLGYILMTMYEMQASHLFSITVPIRENHALYMKVKNGYDIAPAFQDEFWVFQVDDGENFFPYGTEHGVRPYDAASRKMKYVLNGLPGEKMVLEYDFGDSWEVEVALESVFEDKELPGRELPRALEGEGYGIIEDCGGAGGLERLAQAFQQKCGPEYQSYCDWLGRDNLDLSVFDRDDMNFRLKRVPRIYRELYEYGYAPTKRSMDLLERKYRKQK